MAVATGVLSVREGATNTSAQLVRTFNGLHDMIIQSGMLQLADDEFLGQAGIFSLQEGVGLTNISSVKTGATLPAPESGLYPAGYKVYKHPTLNFFLKVFFDSFVGSPSSSNYCLIRYQVSKALLGKNFDKDFTSPIYSFFIHTSHYSNLTVVVDTPIPITVSCGNDHFVISRAGGFKLEASNAQYFGTAYGFIDAIGFAVVCSSIDNKVLCVVTPQAMGIVNGAGFSPPSTTTRDFTNAIKYSVFDGGAWAERTNGAAGSLSEPNIISVNEGIRVTQAQLVVNGVYHRFNFGFVPAISLSNNATVSISLTGVAQKYLSAQTFGSAGHAPMYTTFNKLSTIILPLSE